MQFRPHDTADTSTSLRLAPAAAAPAAAADAVSVVAEDPASLVEIVRELKQEFESHQLALRIVIRRLERLETQAERRDLIG